MEISEREVARMVAASDLFDAKTEAAVLTIMLIDDPRLAGLRTYDIVGGKLAIKSQAVLARFLDAGGKVDWLETTDTLCRAAFEINGSKITIEWDMERAHSSKVCMGKFGMKKSWENFPRAMLRARVIAEGIRAIYPQAFLGIYTTEEVQDFTPDEKPMPTPKPVPKPFEAPPVEKPMDLPTSKELEDAIAEALNGSEKEIDAMNAPKVPTEAPPEAPPATSMMSEAQAKFYKILTKKADIAGIDYSDLKINTKKDIIDAIDTLKRRITPEYRWKKLLENIDEASLITLVNSISEAPPVDSLSGVMELKNEKDLYLRVKEEVAK